MHEYLAELIKSKKRNPEDDLLSGLAGRHDDGDRLTDGELVAMAFLLLVAGTSSTSPTVTRSATATPANWISPGALPDMSPSATASTSVSAHRRQEWRRRSHSPHCWNGSRTCPSHRASSRSGSRVC